MRALRTVSVLILALGHAAWCGLPGAARAHDSVAPLAFLEEKVRGLFRDVEHLGPGQLTRLQARAPETLLLVDVREPAEFAVSRIAGALLLEPETKPTAALAALGDVRDKTVVLYCAIGLRSSRMAAGLQQELRARGARAVYNLSGGLFRWHNESRPLVDARGETGLIHPYKRIWRRYISRRDLMSETPQP